MMTPSETDYRAEYLRIAKEVGKVYPECGVTTIDMVRMALGIPTRQYVVNKLENEAETHD